MTVQDTQDQPLSIEDVKTIVSGMADAILEQVDNRLATIQQPKTEPEPDKGNQSVTARLKQLEDELARRDAEKEATDRQSRYHNTFDEALSQYSLAYPKETAELLRGVFQGQVDEVEGNWLSKDGKSLSDVVRGFMDTDFGRHLLQAPTANGSGSRTANSPKTQPASVGDSLAHIFNLA